LISPSDIEHGDPTAADFLRRTPEGAGEASGAGSDIFERAVEQDDGNGVES